MAAEKNEVAELSQEVSPTRSEWARGAYFLLFGERAGATY